MVQLCLSAVGIAWAWILSVCVLSIHLKGKKEAVCCVVGLKAEPGMRCASFDGDADRIVFFYLGQQRKFHLLDGDKIATLVRRLIHPATVFLLTCWVYSILALIDVKKRSLKPFLFYLKKCFCFVCLYNLFFFSSTANMSEYGSVFLFWHVL